MGNMIWTRIPLLFHTPTMVLCLTTAVSKLMDHGQKAQQLGPHAAPLSHEVVSSGTEEWKADSHSWHLAEHGAVRAQCNGCHLMHASFSNYSSKLRGV